MDVRKLKEKKQCRLDENKIKEKHNVFKIKVLMFGKTIIEAKIIIRAKTKSKGEQRQDFGKMEYKIEAKCRDGS